jgi:hypothetical protein
MPPPPRPARVPSVKVWPARVRDARHNHPANSDTCTPPQRPGLPRRRGRASRLPGPETTVLGCYALVAPIRERHRKMCYDGVTTLCYGHSDAPGRARTGVGGGVEALEQVAARRLDVAAQRGARPVDRLDTRQA